MNTNQKERETMRTPKEIEQNRQRIEAGMQRKLEIKKDRDAMKQTAKHTAGDWKHETWDYPTANPPRGDVMKTSLLQAYRDAMRRESRTKRQMLKNIAEMRKEAEKILYKR